MRKSLAILSFDLGHSVTVSVSGRKDCRGGLYCFRKTDRIFPFFCTNFQDTETARQAWKEVANLRSQTQTSQLEDCLALGNWPQSPGPNNISACQSRKDIKQAFATALHSSHPRCCGTPTLIAAELISLEPNRLFPHNKQLYAQS